MLPLLAPLLGSMFGPTLFGALGMGGMAPWLASGLGSGLASLAVERDPQKALMSGLLSGAGSALTGGLGGLLGNGGGAADLASTASPAALDAGIKGGTMGVGMLANPLNPQNIGKFGDVLNITAPQQGGLSGLMNFMRENPMMTAGALALPALLPNEPEYDEEEPEDIPENFPTHAGPRSGYGYDAVPRANTMSPEDYRLYGRASAPNYSGEWQFFDDSELVAPPSTGGGSGGDGDTGGGGGDGLSQDQLRNILRLLAGGGLAFRDGGEIPGYASGGPIMMPTPKPMAPQGIAPLSKPGVGITPKPMGPAGPTGGMVHGPGGPRDDMVQAVGPGGMPIRLSAGEYVMPASAVQGAGGPRAMDALRSRLIKMQNGGSVGERIRNAARDRLESMRRPEDFGEEDRTEGQFRGDRYEFAETLPTRHESEGRARVRRRRGDPNESEGLGVDVDRDGATLTGRWRTRVPQ